jgi:hypothetical protein
VRTAKLALAALVVAAPCAALATPKAGGAAPDVSHLRLQLNLGFEAADHPQGWFAGGEGYIANIDAVENLAKARGGRLRLSGYLKTETVTGGGAGLWMRVDGPQGILAFDNMPN